MIYEPGATRASSIQIASSSPPRHARRHLHKHFRDVRHTSQIFEIYISDILDIRLRYLRYTSQIFEIYVSDMLDIRLRYFRHTSQIC